MLAGVLIIDLIWMITQVEWQLFELISRLSWGYPGLISNNHFSPFFEFQDSLVRILQESKLYFEFYDIYANEYYDWKFYFLILS